jgi:hypothetical protein
MAELVLTNASAVQCPHGFDVTFASTATLRAGGHPVVRAVDLAAAVFKCAVQTKCVAIARSQTSTVLRDAGSPVVLAAGLATNINDCVVSAAHDVLQAE